MLGSPYSNLLTVVCAETFANEERCDQVLEKTLQLGLLYRASSITLVSAVEMETFPVLEDVLAVSQPGVWSPKTHDAVEFRLQALKNRFDAQLQKVKQSSESERFPVVKYEVLLGSIGVQLVPLLHRHKIDLVILVQPPHKSGFFGLFNHWNESFMETLEMFDQRDGCDILLIKSKDN